MRIVFRTVISMLSLLVLAISLLSAVVTWWLTDSAVYGWVVGIVLLGWGIGNGWVLFLRQLLTAWDRPVIPAALALLPPLIIILGAVAFRDLETLDFAVLGAGAWLLAGGFGMLVPLSNAWRQAGADAHADPPAHGLRDLFRKATPVYGAYANSQVNQRGQDAIAALTMVGGTTIFSNAMSMARLQHVVADALFMSSAYPAALTAITRQDQDGLRAAYRLGLRVQFAISFPIALATLVAGDAAAIAIYAHGKATVADAHAIAQVLYWAAPAMIAVSLQATHAQLLIALGKTREALHIEIGYTVLSLVLAVLLIPLMGLPGLAAGASIGMFIMQFFMVRILTPVGLNKHDIPWELLRAAIPALIATPLALFANATFDHGAWLRALSVGISILIVTLPCSAYSIHKSRQAAPVE